MKMMQDGKDDKKGEQPDAEETEARAWFKENRESSSLTAGDGTELAPAQLSLARCSKLGVQRARRLRLS